MFMFQSFLIAKCVVLGAIFEKYSQILCGALESVKNSAVRHETVPAIVSPG